MFHENLGPVFHTQEEPLRDLYDGESGQLSMYFVIYVKKWDSVWFIIVSPSWYWIVLLGDLKNLIQDTYKTVGFRVFISLSGNISNQIVTRAC